MSGLEVVPQRPAGLLPSPVPSPAPAPHVAAAAAIMSASTSTIATATTPKLTRSAAASLKRSSNGDPKDGRTSKSRQRSVATTKDMEPPVLSFYGENPVPLPSRFGQLKRKLAAGHEAELQASWERLLVALGKETEHIEKHGVDLIPSIDFSEIERDEKVSPFSDKLRQYGIGVIRGVVPSADAEAWVAETRRYLETKHDYRSPSVQDPTCFDFFWAPAQVRSRAHPKVLRAQRFAMSLWDTTDEDPVATSIPIAYADRIRIEPNLNIGGRATDGRVTPPDEPVSEDTTSTLIAQIDNGSLERWEPDGYGREGLYRDIFKGDWESYNPWCPGGRVNATPDLYNGAACCSMFRMFQGILGLTTVEPGMVRVIPSPKLTTAYFLLRPFFASKKDAPAPEASPEEWAEYLHPSNWTFMKEQNTIIHGAVPGHAQRVTERWHPHLKLNTSLVHLPTLQPGDYIIWHPDTAYSFTPAPVAEGAVTAAPSDGRVKASMLVYVPAAPLTQGNALFLARQRKAFLRGHPAPDFDSTGSGLGSEAQHTGRLGEKEIAEVGGDEGLQAMGLAPWGIAKTNKAKKDAETAKDAEMENGTASSSSSTSAGEVEVVRLANIILFPDRYDFYMPTRTPTRANTPDVDSNGQEKSKGKGKDGEKPGAQEREKTGSSASEHK